MPSHLFYSFPTHFMFLIFCKLSSMATQRLHNQIWISSFTFGFTKWIFPCTPLVYDGTLNDRYVRSLWYVLLKCTLLQWLDPLRLEILKQFAHFHMNYLSLESIHNGVRWTDHWHFSLCGGLTDIMSIIGAFNVRLPVYNVLLSFIILNVLPLNVLPVILSFIYQRYV